MYPATWPVTAGMIDVWMLEILQQSLKVEIKSESLLCVFFLTFFVWLLEKTGREWNITGFARPPHALCSLGAINKLRPFFRLPPPADVRLLARPFIRLENIGPYTSVRLCVPEEKQDRSPSPLCGVITPTAGSSHYAIRASRWTWSVALQTLHQPRFPLLSTCTL